jgi:predicted DCC family thiol-disulfide oxidoreductase YuxK
VVFYDGACPLCRREIAHYQRLDRRARIEWVDITRQPERLAGNGIAFTDAMQRLHVRESDGRIVTGAEAFVALWARLPYYRVLARLVSRPWRVRLLDRAYTRFAAWRWQRRCAGTCALDETHTASPAPARTPPGRPR